MCGICGQINLDFQTPVDSKFINRMNNTLLHRGPDDEGTYVKDFVGLAMRRLSIIDVAKGKQPISNEDKTIWIVFNGEIYNFPELRKQLIANGHQFRTNSDTECIVHLYEDEGLEFLNHLRGMFAIAIWDDCKKRLILARDHLGIKPLFYGEHRGQFFFASEMKAILSNSTFPRELDYDSLASYFTLTYIPAPLSIFKGIKKLLPGHYIQIDKNGVKIEKYWDLTFKPDRGKSENEFIEEFMSILEEAVKIRLISEVPLGAFLSGGIDSSAIVALMSKVSSSAVKTFCIGFGGDTGGFLDERKYARQVAERFGADHREYEVLPEPEGLVEQIIRAFDEPFADDSTIPSYFVCKAAKENVTVALSGLGGDEVFAGYERYLGFGLSRIYEKLPLFFRENFMRKLVEMIPERSDGHYTVNHMKRFVRASSMPNDLRYFSYISMLNDNLRDDLFVEPEKIKGAFDLCRKNILSHFNSSNACDSNNPLDLLNRVLYCDIKTYLPEDILTLTDRISMHHALEVRVPFVDYKFMEFAATIPPEMKLKWFQKKYILKKAVRDILPGDVINHRKQGFASPMTKWLQADLKPYVIQTLSKSNLKKHDLFIFSMVNSILDEHFSRKELHDKLIWSLVIFQKWFNMYMT